MKNFLGELSSAAGKILLRYFRKDIRIRYKASRDPVTAADLESEKLLKKMIKKKFPDDLFICEESCPEPGCLSPGRRYWIIDPLDGTVNYSHGLPQFSVSIAVYQKGRVTAGAVYNPAQNLLFTAQEGQGAKRNGKRIKVTQNKRADRALLVTGFPYYTYKNPGKIFDLMKNMSVTFQAVRRLGSAALDLCHVAEGIFDGYWEENLRAWDVAAGSLILKEAGGRVTDYAGGTDYLFGRSIIASNSLIHKKMLSIISEFQPRT